MRKKFLYSAYAQFLVLIFCPCDSTVQVYSCIVTNMKQAALDQSQGSNLARILRSSVLLYILRLTRPILYFDVEHYVPTYNRIAVTSYITLTPRCIKISKLKLLLKSILATVQIH